MKQITILSREVIDDLRSAGWLESEINPDSGLHRRHETADICEDGNVERVWRILGACVAHVKFTLRTVMKFPSADGFRNDLLRPERWTFDFRCPLDTASMELIKEKIHEYLVANVMADRLRVLMPQSAKPWVDSARSALETLDKAAASLALIHPVRRPLWPL